MLGANTHNRGFVSVVKRKAVWNEATQEWDAGDVVDSFTVKNIVTLAKNREEVTDFDQTFGVGNNLSRTAVSPVVNRYSGTEKGLDGSIIHDDNFPTNNLSRLSFDVVRNNGNSIGT